MIEKNENLGGIVENQNGNGVGDLEVEGATVGRRRPGRAPGRQKFHRPSPISRLLRPAEVAEILQVHQSGVYRMARRGVITSVVLPPKTLRFRQSDIEAFIGRCATKSRRQAIP